MPIAFAYTLIVLLVITSVLLTMLVLLHRGKGGGLSSMFGGGVCTKPGRLLGRREEPRPLHRPGRHHLVRVHRRSGPLAESRRGHWHRSRPNSVNSCAVRLSGRALFLSIAQAHVSSASPRRDAAFPAADPRTTTGASIPWPVAARSEAPGGFRPDPAERAVRARPRRPVPTGAPTGTRPRSRSRPTSPRRSPGTAPTAACPAGQDERTRRAGRAEPYKTHLAYVKERRSDADGAAILAEALANLRQRRGGR